MSGYRTIAQAMAQMNVGSSKHRGARVLRFIARHPKAHAKITGQLRRDTQRGMVRARQRFEKMQRHA